MNRAGAKVGQASRLPSKRASESGKANLPPASPTGQAGRPPYFTVHGQPPLGFSHALGALTDPADVAQASSLASAPGVPPGVRAGGETPP